VPVKRRDWKKEQRRRKGSHHIKPKHGSRLITLSLLSQTGNLTQPGRYCIADAVLIHNDLCLDSLASLNAVT
jgi:hypothetical protein